MPSIKGAGVPKLEEYGEASRLRRKLMYSLRDYLGDDYKPLKKRLQRAITVVLKEELEPEK